MRAVGVESGPKTERLSCWGRNTVGETRPPAGVFVQLSVGHGHGCATTKAGTLSCWGGNGYAWLQRRFLPYLRTLGVTDEQMHTIMVENPARVLAVGPAAG